MEVMKPLRFPSPPDFHGLEEVASIRRVEADLSLPTILVFESSRFLGRRITHSLHPPHLSSSPLSTRSNGSFIMKLV